MEFFKKAKRNFLLKSFSKDTSFPLKGFTKNNTEIPGVEILPDWQLEELNNILDWNCFIVDSKGRRFGKPHSTQKRQTPQAIPDERIIEMHKHFNLTDKVVLELGCFEGVHTAALAKLAKRVIAVDSRIENVVKTLVRLGFCGQKADVYCCDIEAANDQVLKVLKADLVHHVGVLYHLKDPVSHLIALGKLAKSGIMLDTHYALPESANESYQVAGEDFSYYRFREPSSYKKVFAGMYDHAKWLTVEGLKRSLHMAGYKNIKIIETRDERNGPRVRLFAF